jgi:apolipoprotein N-acyltransferase
MSIHSEETQAKLINEDVEAHTMVYGYSSWKSGLYAWIGNGLTIALVWGLCSSYPNTLPGPTWLMALISYAPYLHATMSNMNSFTQIYIGTLAVMMGVWMIIPYMMEISIMYGLPFVFGFTVLVSGCLHLWSVALAGRISPWLIARFVALFMTTAFVANTIYGILISVAIQFYRSPLLLQPISVFGFSTLEAVVILINCLVAWIGCLLTQKNWSQLTSRSVARNPLIILSITIAVWCCLSGIIWGSVSSVATVSVATMNMQSLYPIVDQLRADRVAVSTPGSLAEIRVYNYSNSVVEYGEAIAILAKKISPNAPIDMIVLPEFAIHEEHDVPCETLVSTFLAPATKDMKSTITIGCDGYQRNMAYTFNTELPDVVHVYGKMKPTPGEVSLDRPGYSVFDLPKNRGKMIDGATSFNLKASALICYDVDYTDTVSQSVDLGASLIVNPSHDWKAVRHHFAASVIRAVENRVPIIKAEEAFDAAIIDPFGQILAFGNSRDHNTMFVQSLPVSTPLKINYPRQMMAAIAFIAALAGFIAFDIYTLIKRRKSNA